MQPDRLDLEIIGCLRAKPQSTNKAIGRVVGVTEQTVAIRVRTMIENNVMRVVAQRDLTAAGYPIMAFVEVYVVGETTEAVARRLGSIADVFSVVIVPGSPEIIVNVNARDLAGLETIVAERIAAVLGASRHRLSICDTVHKYTTGAGDLHQALGSSLAAIEQEEIDERIIAMLVIDARISNREIGRRIGISEANVRLRLKRLTERKVIRVGVVCEPDKVGYDHSAYIFLQGEQDAVEQAIGLVVAMDEIGFAASMSGDHGGILFGIARDRDTLPELCVSRLRAIHGLSCVSYRGTLRTTKHRFDYTRIGSAVFGPDPGSGSQP